MRKSSVTSRSSFPSGASSCQTTSFGFFLPSSPRSLPMHAVRGAEQVLQEILVALAGRAEQVRAPDEHVARPVLRIVRDPRRTASARRTSAPWRHSPSASMPGRRGVLRRSSSGLVLQLRRRRQPAHALGAHVVVDQRAVPRARRRGRRQDLRRHRASRSATGRCGRRSTTSSSSGAAGGPSRARRRAAASRLCGRSFSWPT